MINVHILHCGMIGLDRSVVFRDETIHPLAPMGILRSPNNRIYVPITTFLIEHPKGLILFDTGWHKDVRDKPMKHLSFPIWFANKPVLPPGWAIDEQLTALGYTASDIDYVVLSHLDADHVSGVELVKDANHIMASEEELSATTSHQIRYYNKNIWKDVTFQEIPFDNDLSAPFNKSFDIFQDNSIKVLFAPGHSQGSTIIKITNNKKFILLVGDSGFQKESWKNIRLPGPVYNKKAMLKTLTWIHQQAKRSDCVGVYATHDREVVPQTITL